MAIPWVEAGAALPAPGDSPCGDLIAAGSDLTPQRLDEAYRKGLFPWYNPGEPVLWWSPDPRMVLRCADFHVSHSLAKRLRQFDHMLAQAPLRVTLNQAFGDVIRHCAQRGARPIGLGAARQGLPWLQPADANGRDATWIGPDILDAYSRWHDAGAVHSVETWVDGRLAGGLYGVSLGRCFFGESMFSLAADASKVALAYLVRYLQRHQVPWIDCQQETPHLASLGAQAIARDRFLAMLAAGRDLPGPRWGCGRLTAAGELIAD